MNSIESHIQDRQERKRMMSKFNIKRVSTYGMGKT